MFETLKALGGQLRVAAGMSGGGPIGLDMGAGLALGAARGCDMELLADVLPAAERALLDAHAGEAGEDDFGGEFEGGDER